MDIDWEVILAAIIGMIGTMLSPIIYNQYQVILKNNNFKKGFNHLVKSNSIKTHNNM